MPRKARFAPPDHWIHITQRGNYRQRTFFSDRDHTEFLSLLGHAAESLSIDVLSYCLMPNHFHLIARSHTGSNISRFVQSFSSQYAQYLHGRLSRAGRLWQGRFFSCVLDESHLARALKYVELNPVHAAFVELASEYRWSSAAAHIGTLRTSLIPKWLDRESFAQLYTPSEWREALSIPQSPKERAAIQKATLSSLPLGSPEFIARLESQFDRPLTRKPIGRPFAVTPRKLPKSVPSIYKFSTLAK